MPFQYQPKTDDSLPRLWWHTAFMAAVIALSIWKDAWGPQPVWGLILVVFLVVGTTIHRWVRYFNYQRVKSKGRRPDGPNSPNSEDDDDKHHHAM